MTQEMASIARAIISLHSSYNVYYNHVPEGYIPPALYFPLPTVEVMSDSLNGFKYHYSWYIKVFHKTTEDAWNAASRIQSFFKDNRNLVPIVEEDGSYTGKYLKIYDVKVNEIEENTMQAYIQWDSHRGYVTGNTVTNIKTDIFQKGEI